MNANRSSLFWGILLIEGGINCHGHRPDSGRHPYRPGYIGDIHLHQFSRHHSWYRYTETY